MVETIKELKGRKNIAGSNSVIDVEDKRIFPESDIEITPLDKEKILKEFDLIRLALEYSQKVYKEKMLPVEEILTIDHQALIMAKATKEYLKKQSSSQLKRENIKAAESFIQVCSLFAKYHSTGNKLYCNNAEKWLATATGLTLSISEMNNS